MLPFLSEALVHNLRWKKSDKTQVYELVQLTYDLTLTILWPGFYLFIPNNKMLHPDLSLIVYKIFKNIPFMH